MKNTVSTKKRHDGGHARFTDKAHSRAPKGLIPCSLTGVTVAVGAMLLLSLALSAVVYSTSDPSAYVTPVAFTVLYISALAGGFTASRLNRHSAVLCGVTVGMVLLVIMFVFSLAVKSSLGADYGVEGEIGLRAAVIVCSLMGAFIGVMKNTNTNKNIKKHKKR